MENIQFGVNRMVAPALDLAGFFDLAAAVGAVGIELRNDLPGYDIIDSMEAAEVRERLARHGIRVLTINAVQHFNLPSAVNDATAELKRLIGFAGKLGNPAIVMCPHCDNSDTRSRAEMAKDTKKALREYGPILEDAGVIGLVEPLGFPESSLRDPSVAAGIIGEIGGNAYKLTLDTFHYAVAGMDSAVLGTATVPAEVVGIVHVSGVTKRGPVAEFRDPDRVYVDVHDRVGNVESLKKLRTAGYNGTASFEPFSPSVHDLPITAQEQALKESINYINNSI